MTTRRVSVVDSHTGGEPTRVVIDGGPDLGDGSLAERLAVFREHHDNFRSAVVCEPRGSDVLVGALLLPPTNPANTAAVIFFNNVGYLGMCGHGTIGLIVTLAHLGKIGPGEHVVETPVGNVNARLHGDGRVSVRNVPSYRTAKSVAVDVPGHGPVTGDVAWGGNWFFLCDDHGQEISFANVVALTNFAARVRQAVNERFPDVDHVELIAPSPTPNVDARNFVLCPGGAYDRSPCGTGTSAKLACLFADGKFKPGEIWRQESIVGSVFEGTIAPAENGAVLPTLTGRAFVTGEATLLLDPADPFCWGVR